MGTERRWERIEAVGVSVASRRATGHQGGTHQCKQTDQGGKNELAVMDGLRDFFEGRIVSWLMNRRASKAYWCASGGFAVWIEATRTTPEYSDPFFRTGVRREAAFAVAFACDLEERGADRFRGVEAKVVLLEEALESLKRGFRC